MSRQKATCASAGVERGPAHTASPAEDVARAFWAAGVSGFVREARLSSFYAQRADLVREALVDLPTGSRVLDLGCGSGWLAVALALRGHNVTALDLSDAQVDRARRLAAILGAELQLRVGGLEALSGETRFDAVCAVGVMPYVADKPEFLRRLAVHVAPRGRLIVSETRAVSVFTLLAFLKHLRGFRPSAAWFEVAQNLLLTGVWSGGFIRRDASVGLRGTRGFDREMAAIGFAADPPICLFGVAPFDQSPHSRGALARWLATRLCWCVLHLYSRRGLHPC